MVPGKEIVVTLESKTSTWEATVLIKAANEVDGTEDDGPGLFGDDAGGVQAAE